MIGLRYYSYKVKSTLSSLLVLATLFLCLSVNAEDILLLRPDEINFKQALDGMEDELDNELTIYDYNINKETTVEDFLAIYNQLKPKMVVLMEGKSVELYKKYQASQPPNTQFPPCLVLMTAYARERIRQLQNATGIAYEIQAVHSLSNLRTLVSQPIERVGVLYSSNLRVFFANQQRMCRLEQIELVGIMVDDSKTKLDRVITKELKHLIRKEKVDAIWILNDNVILKDVHLEWAWVPQLKRFKKPIVVSLERLLHPLKVGHFAVVPDHYELGTQAARMIFNIQDDDWSLAEHQKVRAPYSAKYKLDSKIVPREIQLKSEILHDQWLDFSPK